ncbi:NACHT domain-containing NTPase [Burkholderia sp. L27(2015)]|uniref:NACHT domain-containing protein n=1 Tax=Burkholderia sp. L27(2015) TaxID=1641858 RepID=UPI00131AA601|nr:hypothetical protein [Burkholderia sp. L27(2015)]
MIERQVQQIFPKPAQDAISVRIGFSDFLSRSNIVLLGEPGAGKTYLFKMAAEAAGGRYMTVRQFLNVPPNWANDHIFIDALDEKRGGRGDDDIIDALVQKLFASPPAALRISCRERDWLGESDLEAFQPYFEAHDSVTVLALHALRPEEQREVLESRGLHDVDSFLEEANRRELGEFLRNPQNLLMLAEVVAKNDSWPSTRAELFQKSTQLLLSEHNKAHLRKDGYGPEDLRSTAGALCALRLISGVEGLGIDEQSTDAEFPGFGTIPFLEKDKIRAALRRPVFVSTTDGAGVDYIHRTTAEYLAAQWLASKMNHGLPITRVTALLGLDGRPATELRGLHSWLPVFAPKFAHLFIDADPYGVFVYGDAALLSSEARVHLLSALSDLSRRDPWFRSDDQSRERLAALCDPAMDDAFRSILRLAEPNHAMRLLVLEALAAGNISRGLLIDVASVLIDTTGGLSERRAALRALLTGGDEGKRFVADACKGAIGWTSDAFYLRAEAISSLYGEAFGPSDVITLLTRLQIASEDVSRSVQTWMLTESVPADDASVILDGVPPPVRDNENSRRVGRNASTVSNVLTMLLIQVLKDSTRPSGAKLWIWLSNLTSYDGPSALAEHLRTALLNNKMLLLDALDEGIRTLSVNENWWKMLNDLRRKTQNTLSDQEMLYRLVAQLADLNADATKAANVYEAALSLACLSPTENVALFELLYAEGERADLREVRERALVSEISQWRIDDAQRKSRQFDADLVSNKQIRHSFGQNEQAIREGLLLNWLGWIAQAYFAQLSEVSHESPPRQRLTALLGEKYTSAALLGMATVLARPDLPTIDAVGKADVQGSIRAWWLAVIAALDERWNDNPSLDGLSDELISTAIAINLVCPTEERQGNTIRSLSHSWANATLKQRPELVRDAYVAVAAAGLDAGLPHVHGLHELRWKTELSQYRSAIGFQLLRRYPNAPAQQLQQLLECACSDSQMHADFLRLARDTLAPGHALDAEGHARWLVTAFAIAPAEFESLFVACAQTNPNAIWLLRDIAIPADVPSTRADQHVKFAVELRERIILLVGDRFPDTPHPVRGWSGNQNPWDASEFLKKMVNRISADASPEATASLARLLTNERIVTYRDFILHASASQRMRRLDAEYRQPTWAQTVTTLASGAPANAADLHALVVDTLSDIANRIANANNDIYKRFWNEDGYGKVTNPKPEESCRHVLIDFLRDRLQPLGVVIEPEGHMADGKRADLTVSHGLHKIPVELKRNYHAEVWDAAQTQLDGMYTADPGASRYGVYGIFWFGDARDRKTPLHPTTRSRPESAETMAEMLRYIVPFERRSHIAVLVFDVASPVSLES